MAWGRWHERYCQMTRDELINALGPGRLSSELTQLGLTELSALAGLGMLTALILMLVVRPFLIHRPSRTMLIRGTRGLPPQERILAIARILGYLPESLRKAAYGAQPPPSDAEIERLSRKG